jgi:hypothetical protein
MNLVRIGMTIAVAATLTIAGCGPQEGGARVAPAADEATEGGTAAAPAPNKKARTRISAETPQTGTSSVQ